LVLRVNIQQSLATARAERQAGRLAAARALCEQILQQEPQQADALSLLAMMAHLEGQPAAAVEQMRRAIAARPDEPVFHYNLGTLYHEQDKIDEAIDCYQQALAIKPLFAEALANLGNALRRRGDDADALAVLKQVLKLTPNSAQAHNNVGTALYKLGRIDEALAAFNRSIELKADHAKAHYNRALAWLLTGDFERGWREYEWRWKRPGHYLPPYKKPMWDGSPLAGKTILLFAEQGLGDVLQFIRFAPLVKERGGKVIVACHERLLPLLRCCEGIDELAPLQSAPQRFDVQAPLMSLPRLCGTTLETIPDRTPYLFAAVDLVLKWRKVIAPIQGFRVGVAWQGSRGYEYDRQRSVPLACFEPLANLPSVQLIRLQKEAESKTQSLRSNVEDCSTPPSGTPGIAGVDPSLARRACMVDFGGDLDTVHGAFMDTAAIMQSLDLVITSDTSVAHLAGGLGVPVWVALPFMPDWRWLLNRDDSPWYSTMRLFRQKAAGDWAGVFGEITVELKRRVTSVQAGTVRPTRLP
jgi:Flp pilus assembly protein TadD